MSAQGDAKRRVEREHVERFLARLPEAPRGVLDANWHDKPDAVFVADDGRRIGIEHTRLPRTDAKGKHLTAFDAISQEVASRAEKLYADTGGPRVHVEVLFDEAQRFPSDCRGLAARLVEIVTLFAPAEDGAFTRIEAWQTWRSNVAFPPVLESVSIRATPRFENVWVAVRPDVVMPLSRGALQAVLDQKAAKAEGYVAQLSECWLLVVEEGVPLSRRFNFETMDLKSPFVSPFDRAFVHRLFDGEVHELTLRRP